MTFPHAVPFSIALAVAIGYFAWDIRRSRVLLARWAARTGVEITHSQRRWFFKGPFFWKSTRGQAVFRVSVRDAHGQERTGWVLCGDFVGGVVADQESAIWDEGGGEPHAQSDEASANTRISPGLQRVIIWAVRSPLRTILFLAGALLWIVALFFIRYWIELRLWPTGRTASIGHYSGFVLGFAGLMIVITFAVAAWSAGQQRKRRP